MKYIVTVRGRLKADSGQAAHDTIVDRLSPISLGLGALGHQAYLNPQDPREFFAVDTWASMDGIQKFMSDAADPGAAIGSLFEGQPEVKIWSESGWRAFSA